MDSLLSNDDFSKLDNWKPGILGLHAISCLIPQASPDAYNWLTETLAGRERLHNAYEALFTGKAISTSQTISDTLIVATEAAVALRQEIVQKDEKLTQIAKEASNNPNIWRLPLICLYGLIETNEALIEKLLTTEPFNLAELAMHILDSNETPQTQYSLVKLSSENLAPKARLHLAVALKNSSDPALHSLVSDNHLETPNQTQNTEELSTFSVSIAENTMKSLFALETDSEYALDKLADTLQASQSLTNKLAMRLGKAALEQDDAVSALAAFEQAKDFGGDLTELSIYTAEAKIALNMPGDALEILSHIDYKSPRSQLALDRAYYANGDIVLACEIAVDIIDSIDSSSELAELANILGSAGKHQDASLALEKAIPLTKTPANLLVQQSKHLLACGRIQDARQTAFEAVALETQSSENRIALAEALTYKDTVIQPNYVEALAHWKKALNISPEDTNIQLQFARCALNSGKPEKARDQCTNLLSNNEIDENASDHDRAILGMAHTVLAQSLLHLGETELASQIGELQLTMQDSEMAIESLKEASIIQPTDGHIHHQYGKALMAEKNYLGAVDALKRASEVAPADGTVWHDLGLAYQEIGDESSALDSLQRAQASGLNSSSLSQRTGELALALQEYEVETSY